MKESIGGTQLFAIVISLILLFAGITALTVNRSNAFTVKDQLVAIIEKAGGFDMTSEIVVGATGNNETLQQIVDSLSQDKFTPSTREEMLSEFSFVLEDKNES